MGKYPRIVSVASAFPPHRYTQEQMCAYAQQRILGADWPARPDAAQHAQHIAHLFGASRVHTRQSAVELETYFARERSTADRMEVYKRASYDIGRAALSDALMGADLAAGDISDEIVVSCTGYTAPGLDILLARDLGMPRDVRRVVVGHMGCYGAVVGLRQALAATRAHPDATVALLSVELTTLHFMPTLDTEQLTSFALFGDAASATLLRGPEVDAPETPGAVELVDTYSAADFATADQMSWDITDTGFVMGLSPRVPVTLRRNIVAVMERLLAPHGLTVPDVRHWLVHPGGPSILDAIQGKLELSDAQMARSWRALADHGNCSSATVLLILEDLLRSGEARPGDWGVMMAFGPGLTLETCLLRF